MAISLNSVNSEVARAHKRIDALTSVGGFPNIAKRQTRSFNTNYTESTNGWIWYSTIWEQNTFSLTITIDGVRVIYDGTDAAWSALSGLVPVRKGATWKATTGRSATLCWIPNT